MNLWARAKSVWRGLMALLVWLVGIPGLWAGLVVCFVALPIYFFLLRRNIAESEIRLVGGLLQAVGIGAVLGEIYKTRARYKSVNLLKRTREWILNRPAFLGGAGVSGSGGAALTGVEADLSLGHLLASGAGGTLEARVAALEKDVQTVNTRLYDSLAEIQRRFRAHEKALDEEKGTREIQDRDILAALKDAETSGLELAEFGAVLVLVGTILSSVPATWFS